MPVKSDHYITKQTKFATLFNCHVKMIQYELEHMDDEEKGFEHDRSEWFEDILEGMEHQYPLSPCEVDIMQRFHRETFCSPDIAYEHTQSLLGVLYRDHVDTISNRLGIL